jgi:hypothetical protein
MRHCLSEPDLQTFYLSVNPQGLIVRTEPSQPGQSLTPRLPPVELAGFRIELKMHGWWHWRHRELHCTPIGAHKRQPWWWPTDSCRFTVATYGHHLYIFNGRRLLTHQILDDS